MILLLLEDNRCGLCHKHTKNWFTVLINAWCQCVVHFAFTIMKRRRLFQFAVEQSQTLLWSYHMHLVFFKFSPIIFSGLFLVWVMLLFPKKIMLWCALSDCVSSMAFKLNDVAWSKCGSTVRRFFTAVVLCFKMKSGKKFCNDGLIYSQ